MIRLLASVRDAREAQLAVAGGADIVDFKDPAHGALGALEPTLIAAGLRQIEGAALTSATSGDWPLNAPQLRAAVLRTAATGVDYVKLGLLPGLELEACIEALAALAASHRLVAVFFADRGVPLDVLPKLQAAGFAGAMIDTFDKRQGGLRQCLHERALRDFVRDVQALGLLAGLAGSLQLDDIEVLAPLGPDLLGFRGALCEAADRTSSLSARRVALARAALNRAHAPSRESASPAPLPLRER
jgi:dihydroneopterin aldolase